jgi:hypothetical protein
MLPSTHAVGRTRSGVDADREEPELAALGRRAEGGQAGQVGERGVPGLELRGELSVIEVGGPEAAGQAVEERHRRERTAAGAALASTAVTRS